MSKSTFVFAMLIALCVAVAQATKGVDLTGPVAVSGLKCLRENGYPGFAIIRVGRSTGQIDTHGAATIINAHNAGFPHVDGYIFPCPRCGDPEGQVKRAIQALRNAGANIGMLWLDIEGTQYWGGQEANRAFFNGLVSGCRAAGVTIGVYTSASQWNPIMGSWNGGASFPLWYAHYDNNPSFSDFKPFGGWSRPAIKQYNGDRTVCGLDVDVNFY